MKIASPHRLLAAFLAVPPLGALSLPTAPALPIAGELQREHIAADARWVGHFDLQGFLRTRLWQRIVEFDEFQEEAVEGFAEIERELGIDPLKEVFSVTVYGMGDTQEPAVVLVETTSAIDHALERFSKEGDYRRFSQQGLEVHSWGNEGFVHVVSRSNDRRLVVVAHDIDELVAGVRVVEGQAPSMARGGKARVTASPLAGSFAFFAAADGIPGIHEIDPASQVAHLATGIVLDVGETGGELFARANVQTPDVDAALDLTDVCDGLIALGRLAVSSQDLPPEVTSVMRALQVETRGNEVLVEFRYSVDQLLQLIEQLSEYEDDDESLEEVHERREEREFVFRMGR